MRFKRTALFTSILAVGALASCKSEPPDKSEFLGPFHTRQIGVLVEECVPLAKKSLECEKQLSADIKDDPNFGKKKCKDDFEQTCHEEYRGELGMTEFGSVSEVIFTGVKRSMDTATIKEAAVSAHADAMVKHETNEGIDVDAVLLIVFFALSFLTVYIPTHIDLVRDWLGGGGSPPQTPPPVRRNRTRRRRNPPDPDRAVEQIPPASAPAVAPPSGTSQPNPVPESPASSSPPVESTAAQPTDAKEQEPLSPLAKWFRKIEMD